MTTFKQKAQKVTEDRDALVVKLSEQGLTSTEIGADPRIKLSAQRIAQILAKHKE